MTAARVRLATTDDADAVGAIYAPYVRETAISFETAVPGAGEMRQRIAGVAASHVWLVYDDGGTVRGYAYASSHRDRAAYQWSVDVAVYVEPARQRRGIGRALYAPLIAALRRLGYGNAYAGITLPNDASVGLHEAMGFRLVGVYRNVGYKLGAWHDVGWWGLALKDEYSGDAAEPSRLSDLSQDEVRRLLETR